jgi:hypothetical protein
MIQAWVKARPKASSGAPDIQRVSTKQLALIIFNHFFFGGFLAANTFKQPSRSEKTRQTFDKCLILHAFLRANAKGQLSETMSGS